MNLELSRTSAALIWVILATGPFAVWLLIYWILKSTSINRRKLLPFLRTLRVITWALAMLLIFVAIVDDSYRSLFVFGFGILAFSTGLSFPQSWLRKKLGLPADAE